MQNEATIRLSLEQTEGALKEQRAKLKKLSIEERVKLERLIAEDQGWRNALKWVLGEQC